MIISIGKRIAFVLSAGCILMFFSEHMFWARFRPESDSLGNYVSTWIAYSLTGYAALAVLSIFRVRRAAGVFLAGAVFGWLVEGVVVGTTYEILPLSISFTGLAWHALISFTIGLWALPILLSRRRAFVLPAVIGLGLFFGAWAINWNANPQEYHAPAFEFILFAAAATVPLIPAYGIFTALRRSPMRIHPAEGVALILAALFFFVFRAIAQPVALCVLPALMGITFAALWWNRRKETAGSLLADPLPPAPAWALLAFLLIAAIAAGIFVPAVWLGLKLQTNILFYLLLMPLGFILYFAALWRIFADRRGLT
ncbi:MAG: hypothetical protein JW748_05870 [Anaerolineales bacterium]|nr:hypothetical protein [Anaerolineales bacterium]